MPRLHAVCTRPIRACLGNQTVRPRQGLNQASFPRDPAAFASLPHGSNRNGALVTSQVCTLVLLHFFFFFLFLAAEAGFRGDFGAAQAEELGVGAAAPIREGAAGGGGAGEGGAGDRTCFLLPLFATGAKFCWNGKRGPEPGRAQSMQPTPKHIQQGGPKEDMKLAGVHLWSDFGTAAAAGTAVPPPFAAAPVDPFGTGANFCFP